ncbi:DUF7368 family protein [Mycolicibacterium canariasense]|uniref:DUF7368 family protein n=1 Tax=Mycolicibacterium canariasense TaxID=228230 RepID=UPI0032D5AD7C
MIDWFAVECVVNGTKIPLTNEERRAAVRRLTKYMHNPGESPTFNGESYEVIAERLGCSSQTILRIRRELPDGQWQSCPQCGQDMWVTAQGWIEPHPDSYAQQCDLSGVQIGDGDDDEEQAALLVTWLAALVKSGHSPQVWERVTRMDAAVRARVLMVALAAVPARGNPFAWLEKTA